MKSLNLIIFIIIILVIIIFNNKEKFTNNEAENIKNTLKNLWGDILDITTPNIKKFKNSTKISVSNIIRLLPCNTQQFSHKLTFTETLNENMTYTNKIIYDYDIAEHINNQPTGIIIGNKFSTEPDNLSYGFIVTYNPENVEHNFAYIGLDFTKNIKDIKENNNPIRKVIEIFTQNNSTSDLLPYFTKGENNKDIKFLGIFEEQNNLEFIKSLKDRKFNLLDLYGNQIISGCKVDLPYCNIELPYKGSIQGRNGLIVGKYSPEDKGIRVLHQNNEILKYSNIKECNTNRNEHKSLFLEKENTKKLDFNNDLIKNDKEFITNNFINKTGLECRKHNSEFEKKFYYGGIDKDGIMKCNADNMECIYYDNEKDCLDKTKDIEKFEFYNLDPTDSQDPSFIDEKLHQRYNDYKEINCIRTNEKESVCKHIHNRMLSDIITFSIDECLEKNTEDILNNKKVLQLREIPGLGEITPEQEQEFYKNKYFMEEYSDSNPMLYFQNMTYFMKLINNFDPNTQEINTICELIKINKDKSQTSIGYMLDSTGNILNMKPNYRIYMCITNKNKLSFAIIDENNSIISQHIFQKKIDGKFGSNISYCVATNNTNIFDEPNYTINYNGINIPYISSIKINVSE